VWQYKSVILATWEPEVRGCELEGSEAKLLRTYLKSKRKKGWESQAPVTHACNPSYSEGRDQEDQSFMPTWANSLRDPILKISNTKKG
jgi:hypothetical protein